MSLNWSDNDYFVRLLKADKRGYAALECLVDDLHVDKDRTIGKLLRHSGSEDFLWALVKLLGDPNSRVAGNAAYILGTLAENELGYLRVISLINSKCAESKRILSDLTNMLTFDDSESVMNAAGTIGTLAESPEGREWMLRQECLDDTIDRITHLLSHNNLWTASNAALVLARITISEDGCERLLCHSNAPSILTNLILSLGVDEAGRGMNAAFAVGRLCDTDKGRHKLLSLPESERMISSLSKMLCCNDSGASKNACFAISCLATNPMGHSRLLENQRSEIVLKTLAELLCAEDSETAWFSAMTLHTLASQPKGCLRLRKTSDVTNSLRSIAQSEMSEHKEDLKEEVNKTLAILKRLDKAESPDIEQLSFDKVLVKWEESKTNSGLKVKYQLFLDDIPVYSGDKLEHDLNKLQPHTTYSVRLRAFTEGDEAPLSDPVNFTTAETVPTIPLNFRLLVRTTTQLKLTWDPPEFPNGQLKGYYVYLGDKLSEHTYETSCIVSSLQPSSTYEFKICAATSKGKGPFDQITATTAEMGAHAPSKPEVVVLGRNELTVSWSPPEVPLGRISRYDLVMNNKTIYSGTDLHFHVTRLSPDTEYTFHVTAVTSEGKCESRTTKKKTAKDEYEGERQPLYQTPVKKDGTEVDIKVDSPPKSVKRRRKSTATVCSQENVPAVQITPRVSSASAKKKNNHSHSALPKARLKLQKVRAKTPDVTLKRSQTMIEKPVCLVRKESVETTVTSKSSEVEQQENAPIPRRRASISKKDIEVSEEETTKIHSKLTMPKPEFFGIKKQTRTNQFEHQHSANSTRKESQTPYRLDITRTFTTFNLLRTASQNRPKPGYADENQGQAENQMPSLRRAATFVQNNRRDSGLSRSSNNSNCNNNNFVIDVPETVVRSAANHTKFVPMQFRTQPQNLPSSLHRQATMVKGDKSTQWLDNLPKKEDHGHLTGLSMKTKVFQSRPLPNQLPSSSRKPKKTVAFVS